jgi:hypothetical protein
VIRLVILFLFSSRFIFRSLQLPSNPASSISSLHQVCIRSASGLHQVCSTDTEHLRAFYISFARIANCADRNVRTSGPLAPFTINETNSNFEQFQEKFSLVEENGLVDAHLTRFLRSLLPADDGGASSIPIPIDNQTRAGSIFF